MQRVRLQVRLFKGYLMRPCTAYPTTVNCRAVKGALNGAKGVSFLVLALSLGATTTCCCCHCRHLFLINFNCFHFFAAYVSVSPYQGPTVKQQSVIAKKFFNFNEISAKNKSNLKPQMQITLLLSYNFECFFALKFAMRIFPPAKLYVCEIVVFVTRPLPRPSYLPLIPPGPIRSCQLRLSPAFDNFTLWFTLPLCFFSSYLFVSIFICFLSGDTMKSACHSSSRRARAYVYSVSNVRHPLRLKGGALWKIDATKCLVNLRQKGIFYCNLLNLHHILAFILTLQPEQIQAEYKALALQYHPDKNSGDKEAEAKFQQLKVS